MDLVVLPIIAALVLLFGLRFLGRLITAVLDADEYNTADTTKASWPQETASQFGQLGAMGTPLLVVGAAFGVRYGWAPVFLWILIAATTIGALVVIARGRPAQTAGSDVVDRGFQMVAGAVLALLWAGIAAANPEALLAFAILYGLSFDVNNWLTKGGLEQVIGVLAVIAIAFLTAILGHAVPLAVEGPLRVTVGPLHILASSGEIVFYVVFFLLFAPRARRKALMPFAPAGAVGVLLFALIGTLALVGAFISHPVIAVPRLAPRGLWMAWPMLATALPFAAAIAPLRGRDGTRPSLLQSYRLSLGEAVIAVLVLIAMISAFPTHASWASFFQSNPGPVSLLQRAGAGFGVLGHTLALGVLRPLFAASLLLLIAAAFEGIQFRITQIRAVPQDSAAPQNPIVAAWRHQPLLLTALAGAALWFGLRAGAAADIFIGALLGFGAIVTLTARTRDFPPFVVSLSFVLLVLIDIALGIIGWTAPLDSPKAAGVAIVFMIEAAWIIWLWRTGSRFKDYASRRLRN